MDNTGVLKSVIEATGLPEAPVQTELSFLLNKNGLRAEDVTLDELREIMAEYLNLVFLEMAPETPASA